MTKADFKCIPFKPKHERDAVKNRLALIEHVRTQPDYQTKVTLNPTKAIWVRVSLPILQGRVSNASLSHSYSGERLKDPDLIELIPALFIEAAMRRFYIDHERDAKNWRVNHVLLSLALTLECEKLSIHELNAQVILQLWKTYYAKREVNVRYNLALLEVIDLLNEYKLLHHPFALPELTVRDAPRDRANRQSTEAQFNKMVTEASGRALMELGGRMLAAPEQSDLLNRFTSTLELGKHRLSNERLQQAYGPVVMVPLLNALGAMSRTNEILHFQTDCFQESIEEGKDGKPKPVLALHKFARKTQMEETIPLDSEVTNELKLIQQRLEQWSEPARTLSAYLEDQGVTKADGYPDDQPVYLPAEFEWLRGVGATRPDIGKILGLAVEGNTSELGKFCNSQERIDPTAYHQALLEMVKARTRERLGDEVEHLSKAAWEAEVVETAKGLGILDDGSAEKYRDDFLTTGRFCGGGLKVRAWPAVEDFLKSQIIKNLPKHFPYFDPERGVKYRDSLFIGLGNQFNPQAILQRCWVAPLSKQFQNLWYGRKSGKDYPGLFKAFGYFEENEQGEQVPCYYDTHSDRHKGQTHLLLQGVDIGVINRMSGRSSAWQARTYDLSEPGKALIFNENRELETVKQSTKELVWKQTAVDKAKKVWGASTVFTEKNIILVKDKNDTVSLMGQHEIGGAANGFRVCSRWDLTSCEHSNDCFMCESLTCYSAGDSTDLEKIAKLELDIDKTRKHIEKLEGMHYEEELAAGESLPKPIELERMEKSIERREVLLAFYKAKKPRPLFLASLANPSPLARKTADVLIDFPALKGASPAQIEIEIQKLITP